MENDGIQIISSLGIDYQQIVKGVEELSKSFDKLDNQLEKIRKSATMAAQDIANAFSKQPIDKILQEKFGNVQGSIEKISQRMAQSAANSLPMLEAQVAAVQAKLRTEGLYNVQLNNQSNIIRSQITALKERLSIEGKLTEAEVAQVGALKQQLNVLQQNVKTAIADSKTGKFDFWGRLFSPLSFSHHLNFWLTSMGLVGIYDTLGAGLVEYEKGLKGLSTVLPQINEDQKEFFNISNGILRTMEKYGVSLQDTMQVGRSLGRMYKETSTVLGLLDQVTLLNVIDNVELENAVKGVEAALATYGRTLKGTNEVLAFSGRLVDELTALSHNAFASAQDLIDILERSSSAAIGAKVSLEELLGLGAAATRATGLPGTQIGKNILPPNTEMY